MRLRNGGNMRVLPMAMLVIAVLLSGMTATSCKDDSKIGTASVGTADIPTMMTRDVETLISDSGVTRYRITTPVWYVYDEVEEPYWKFPEGLNLDKFDNFFRTEATVRADSARYMKRRTAVLGPAHSQTVFRLIHSHRAHRSCARRLRIRVKRTAYELYYQEGVGYIPRLRVQGASGDIASG